MPWRFISWRGVLCRGVAYCGAAWHGVAGRGGARPPPTTHHSPPTHHHPPDDNTMASSLEATVRDGDPDGEGVVWPHLAEISLLGGLGCGKALVQLVVDDLEAAESQ